MMWEPTLNGTEVSAQFLRLYYSDAAAPHMQGYMDARTDRMRTLDYYMQLSGWEMTTYVRTRTTTVSLAAYDLRVPSHSSLLHLGILIR
jgi:hypothetical protein